MALNTYALISGLSTVVIRLAVTAALICGYTYLTTVFRFQLDARKHTDSEAKVQLARSPPLVPYVVPGLGSTITFSDQNIGAYWTWLHAQAVRYGQIAFSIILTGTRTNFIFSEAGVSAIFKSRQLSRAKLDQQLGVNVLAMSKWDAVKAFPYDVDEKEKSTTARIQAEHLLSSAAVNALTSKFMETFCGELATDARLKEGLEVDLYDWLWQRIFSASTTVLCGSNLPGMHPAFGKDYKVWEDNMLGMLFGKPRLFARQADNARGATVQRLETWLEAGYEIQLKDSEDPDW